MDAATELERNPGSKHQIQPEYGNEQADAGRACRTRLARPNSQTRTGTVFPCSADHEQDCQSYPVDSTTSIINRTSSPAKVKRDASTTRHTLVIRVLHFF